MDVLKHQFVRALDELEIATGGQKEGRQNTVFRHALDLLHAPDGIEFLHQFAPRYEAVGLFDGSEWGVPEDLNPRLVRSTLQGMGLQLAVECLSELRLLSIWENRLQGIRMTGEDARRFLETVVALNIDFLYPGYSPTSRIANIQDPGLAAAIQRLLQLITERLGAPGILSAVVDESVRVLHQRPIVVEQVKTRLAIASETIALQPDSSLDAQGAILVNALYGPTPLSQSAVSLESYEEQLDVLSEVELVQEAKAFGDALWATGLASRMHAMLLRHLNRKHPSLIGYALRLEGTGYNALSLHMTLVHDLIDTAVHPETAQCTLGLANMLASGRLYFQPVAPSLRRIMGMDVAPEVAVRLEASLRLQEPLHELSARSILLAGTLSVLGQPLGIGQGDNPTCQAARAISLWAQSDTGYLLELIAQAAIDDSITTVFEGESLHSGHLPAGNAGAVLRELDPVSVVLVPHLDSIYAEIARKVASRGGDPHKWINPEFHGWWVFRGFALALNVEQQAIVNYHEFMRLFYASYHPEYRGHAELIYPQPIGIASTDRHGTFIGWHAISIQRVAMDADGEIRAYFYNPHNDGWQDWGLGVVTSTVGHGEIAGESSLPFDQFASRVYLYHFSVREHGDPSSVPDEEVTKVERQASLSWGAGFSWQ